MVKMQCENALGRRRFLGVAAGAMSGLWALDALSQAPEGKRPPNLVLILIDDIGAKELGCYGNTEHKTPVLDGMAAKGVFFQTAYAAPLCHPTRVMLMTGQYGCHNGVYNFAGRRGGPAPDAPVEDMTTHLTFAQLLKTRGYATALAGKWQLSGAPPTQIFECGFDEYSMWAYRHNIPKEARHSGAMEDDEKTARYWNPSIVRNGTYIPTKPDDYGPDIELAFLTDFAKRHKDEPLFLYWPMTLTHAPHQPTPDSRKEGETIEGKTHNPKNFTADVEYVDKLVGKLDAALGELGVSGNTVFLVTGDNGTGGEGKGQVTELGARVPMIAYGPGIVQQRGATDELMDLSDIFPTLAGYSGASLPEGRPMDGKSLVPFLRGETETTRDWIFSFLGDGRILRDKRWLLEDNTPHRFGRLYDCGHSRDGSGYKEVTGSNDPEALAAKKRFEKLLEQLPAPEIPEEGDANDVKPERAARRERKQKEK